MSNWRKDAACRSASGVDRRFISFNQDEVNEAKAICATCPVSVDCIKWAIETNSEFVAAGTSLYDRILMQWREVKTEDESNLRGSEFVLSGVLSRL